jgi:hypothetical protein
MALSLNHFERKRLDQLLNLRFVKVAADESLSLCDRVLCILVNLVDGRGANKDLLWGVCNDGGSDGVSTLVLDDFCVVFG